MLRSVSIGPRGLTLRTVECRTNTCWERWASGRGDEPAGRFFVSRSCGQAPRGRASPYGHEARHRARAARARAERRASAAVVPTALVNVPMNEALAAIDPAGVDAAALWSNYSARWTFWNTVRTLTTTAALAVAIFPLIESR